MNIRTLAVATVAAFALTGCSDTGDQPEAAATDAAASASPSSTVEGAESPVPVHTEIPDGTLERFFPENASGTDNRVTRVSNGQRLDRVLLPCDSEEGLRDIDRDATTFAHTRFEDDGYLIQRQLTLYPDAETAQKFVGKMGEAPIGCDKLMGSDEIGGMTRTDHGPDRFFGVQDMTAVFSEGYVYAGKKSEHKFAWIDIVSTRGNAVMLTRVGRSGYPESDIAATKDKHRPFVRQVRAHGNQSATILDTLR